MGNQIIRRRASVLDTVIESFLFCTAFQSSGICALWITKTWGLGTHYDIFDSWDQALIGQIVYGSLVQIIPGSLLGSLTLAIRRHRKSVMA